MTIVIRTLGLPHGKDKVSDRVLRSWTVTVDGTLARIVTLSYQPEAKWSFSVSVQEPRGQIVDGIKCGKVTTRSRGSIRP